MSMACVPASMLCTPVTPKVDDVLAVCRGEGWDRWQEQVCKHTNKTIQVAESFTKDTNTESLDRSPGPTSVFFLVLGIKPRASNILSACPTTKLHPQPYF